MATGDVLWSNNKVFGLLSHCICSLEGACWLFPDHEHCISTSVEKTYVPSFLLPLSSPSHMEIKRYIVLDKTLNEAMIQPTSLLHQRDIAHFAGMNDEAPCSSSTVDSWGAVAQFWGWSI